MGFEKKYSIHKYILRYDIRITCVARVTSKIMDRAVAIVLIHLLLGALAFAEEYQHSGTDCDSWDF